MKEELKLDIIFSGTHLELGRLEKLKASFFLVVHRGASGADGGND